MLGNKMQKQSAGILMYKLDNDGIKFFLIHPGGPYWKNKDIGSWSIPKGEIKEGEELFDAAIREFLEETGIEISKDKGDYLDLGSVKQASGKIVHCFSIKKNFSGKINCTTYVNLEFPSKSGKHIEFPEADEGKYFDENDALKKIHVNQKEFIDRLINKLELKKEAMQKSLF